MGIPSSSPAPPEQEPDGLRPRLRPDGRFQAHYTAGYLDNGQAVRRSVYGATRGECQRNLERAMLQAATGWTQLARAPRLGEWLDDWLANIAPRTARPKTIAGYRNKIDVHLRGHAIRQRRLDKLTAGDLDALYADLLDHGTREPTILGLHRILNRALNIAVRRRMIPENPLTRIETPKNRTRFRPRVYSTDEVRRMLALANTMDDGARWHINLILGLRQGEALGLTWDDINWDKSRLRVEREIYTLKWHHGCRRLPDGTAECGRRYGSNCPSRHGGGFFTGTPKSDAGIRTCPLPQQVLHSLRRHRHAQLETRRDWKPFTDQFGNELELVFCRPNGQPLTGKSDWIAWKKFLAAANVPDGRVHDGRHTAATTLLLLGVPPRVVMAMLGWSQEAMLTRYQHVLEEMYDDVTASLDEHWSSLPLPGSFPGPDEDVIDLTARLHSRKTRDL